MQFVSLSSNHALTWILQHYRLSKNIVRKFKSSQRKREIYNKYNGHYLQLERAKKKQRYSLMDGAKKEELLETCAKKY